MNQASVGLILTLLGSAAAAAFITAWWQRNRYEAEVVHASFSSVVAAHASLVESLARCAGLLRVEATLGHIWESQRQDMRSSLEAARERLLKLESAISVYTAIDRRSDPASVAAPLRAAARAVVAETGRLVAWAPVPEREHAIVTLLAPGTTHAELAEQLERGLGVLDEQIQTFLRSVRGNWVALLRFGPRTLALTLVGLLAFVIGAGFAWKLCVYLHRP